MSAASPGQVAVAGGVPGERIATTEATADDSATSGTTEQSVDEVTAAVVTGRTYRIRMVGSCSYSVANDRFLHRIREGSGTGGAQLTYVQIFATTTSVTLPYAAEVEWTASSTGSQTFSFTLQRTGGTGTCQARGAASQPRYIYVDYIRG